MVVCFWLGGVGTKKLNNVSKRKKEEEGVKTQEQEERERERGQR